MRYTFSERIGWLDLNCTVEDGAVVSLGFGTVPVPGKAAAEAAELWGQVRREIGEYLAGERREFDIPLRPSGSPFCLEVWRALGRIPYGETVTYGELAAAIGRPGAARAVGMGCHKNPIVILIPCHRVVGSGGVLTGFAGGLDVKARLLETEKIRLDGNRVRSDV